MQGYQKNLECPQPNLRDGGIQDLLESTILAFDTISLNNKRLSCNLLKLLIKGLNFAQLQKRTIKEQYHRNYNLSFEELNYGSILEWP